jgi:hypothetical protein
MALSDPYASPRGNVPAVHLFSSDDLHRRIRRLIHDLPVRQRRLALYVFQLAAWGGAEFSIDNP